MKLMRLFIFTLIVTTVQPSMLQKELAKWREPIASNVLNDCGAEDDLVFSPGFMLQPLPNWDKAMVLSSENLLRSAHFELMATMHNNPDMQLTLYIATAAMKQKGTPNITINIEQSARGSSVTVYDAQGKKVTGAVPQLKKYTPTVLTQLLPWRDNAKIFYSVLVQTIEQVPHVVVVMHTRAEDIGDDNYYRPASVAGMLDRYACKESLQERPHCYLHRIKHMRLLSMPYASKAYALSSADKLFLTWSSTRDDMRVTPRS